MIQKSDSLDAALCVIRDLIEQNCTELNGWFDTGFITAHKAAMEFLHSSGYPCVFHSTYGRGGKIKFHSLEAIDIQVAQELKQLTGNK